MIAYGLVCHKHSYLRDAWCQLDFVVVTLAWLPIMCDGALPIAPPPLEFQPSSHV